MNHFIFKSPKRLIKNESLNLDNRLDFVLKEQRHQRSDLQDIKRMLNKLLIDKHLQQQVDEYFEQDKPEPDSADLD